MQITKNYKEFGLTYWDKFIMKIKPDSNQILLTSSKKEVFLSLEEFIVRGSKKLEKTLVFESSLEVNTIKKLWIYFDSSSIFETVQAIIEHCLI